MQRMLMLLAALGLFTWSASSADAAHRGAVPQTDFSSSLHVAPDTVTLNQPNVDRLAGHCGRGYYGRGGYGGGYYAPHHSFRPSYFPSPYYGGYHGRRHHHHHHHRHHGHGGFGLYIGF